MKRIGILFIWIPYIILWMILLVAFMLLRANGGMIDFGITFGKMFKTIYCMVVLLVFASPIILRVVFHDRGVLYSYKKAVLLTIAIAIVSLWLNSYGISKITFSQQGWIEYPQARQHMYYDLVEKNELDKMTKNDIITLLGKPDSEEMDLFVYETDTKYNVYILFDKETVSGHYVN